YFLKPATEDLPPKGVIIPLVDLGLSPYSDRDYNGGNSTAEVYISRETIDRETINVINIKTNLAKSEKDLFAQAQTRKTNVLQHLRSANGIRFKARGDGRFWRVQLQTAETKDDSACYQYSFAAIHDQIITVDIPYSSLTFNDWGRNYRHYDFEKETIKCFIISANFGLQDYGPALLQIWDFEVY
ncbi:MAG: CIA30 family protein, partial [Treponema sp.]|nr:CIA30 family protein [Treponema sp.]